MDHDPLLIKDILVPVDGSPVSLDALALACSLGRRNKGTVYAVYVIEVSRTMPLDAEMTNEARDGENVLADAERLAETLEYSDHVYGELLQARDAGHAIVDEAVERGVAAILMGVSYRQSLGEFELGHTAQYVIKATPCRVILLRSALQE